MTAITFDTLKFVETLKASGFDGAQAKGMAIAIQEAQKSNFDAVATKGDVTDLKRDIKDLDTKIDTKLKELEYRMTIRLGLMMVAVVGMFFAALRYFPPPVQTHYQPTQEMRQSTPAPPVATQPTAPPSATK